MKPYYEEQDDDEPDPWRDWHRDQDAWSWSGYGSQWQRGWDWWQRDRGSSWWTPTQPPSATPISEPEILPDMIQGWYLLIDANLNTQERNMILASVKEDFRYERIAQELKTQWSDEDLRQRDQATRHSSLWVDDEDDIDSEDYQDAWSSVEGLNEEGAAMVIAAQEEAERAMVAVQQGRKTLREARDRQHQVRMSRKYFKTTFKSGNRDFRTSSTKTSTTCLRCGGDHRTSNCPKPSSGASASAAEHSAPFICFAQDERPHTEEALASDAGPTTPEVVQQGKAVLDGGATRTIGSVKALECLMNLNMQTKGNTGLESLDTAERPVFGFGNSTTNQCISTASFKIAADGRGGQLQVHALDHGEGPVLFSIASLRALGAIVDFAEDLVVFRQLTDKKIIPLERSSTGHQLLPLTKDWYEGAHETARPVPSLRDFL